MQPELSAKIGDGRQRHRRPFCWRRTRRRCTPPPASGGGVATIAVRRLRGPASRLPDAVQPDCRWFAGRGADEIRRGGRTSCWRSGSPRRGCFGSPSLTVVGRHAVSAFAARTIGSRTTRICRADDRNSLLLDDPVGDRAVEGRDAVGQAVDHGLDVGGDLVLVGAAATGLPGLSRLPAFATVPEKVAVASARRGGGRGDWQVKARVFLAPDGRVGTGRSWRRRRSRGRILGPAAC